MERRRATAVEVAKLAGVCWNAASPSRGAGPAVVAGNGKNAQWGGFTALSSASAKAASS